MHNPGRHAVKSGNEPCTGMSEREWPAWRRKTYLACMEMPREDQVERGLRHPVDDARKVAEQQSERGIVLDEEIGPRASVSVRDRIDPDDQQVLSVVFELHSIVGEKGCVLEVAKLGGS